MLYGKNKIKLEIKPIIGFRTTVYPNGKKLPGLVRRRADEANLFFT